MPLVESNMQQSESNRTDRVVAPAGAFLGAAFAVALMLAPSPAEAEGPPNADALFKVGHTAIGVGAYDLACAAFARSQEMQPRPNVLFALAECEFKRGHYAAANARFDEYIAAFDALPHDQQATRREWHDRAVARKADLPTKLSRLAVALPDGAPPATVVRLDGTVIDAARAAAPIELDPGEHVLTTLAPGGTESQTRVVLASGERRQVQLDVKLPAPLPPPREEPPPAPKCPPPAPAPQAPVETAPVARHAAAYVVGLVGVAGLVTGALSGGLTLEKIAVMNQHCGIRGNPDWCDAEGRNAADSGRPLGVLSMVSLGVGIAGMGTMVVLVATEKPSSRPAAAGSAARLSRPGITVWGSAGAQPGGRAGSIVGLRGSF